MKKREDCRCRCHRDPDNVKHVIACCEGDPLDIHEVVRGLNAYTFGLLQKEQKLKPKRKAGGK